MACRGIRGATVVAQNEASAILAATRQLLEQMVTANHVEPADLAAVIFTVTPDLDAVYPARAAREMGWLHVPLTCTQEMEVPGSLRRCIRVLALWNTDLPPQAIRHVYLGEARALRPDLADEATTSESAQQRGPHPV